MNEPQKNPEPKYEVQTLYERLPLDWLDNHHKSDQTQKIPKLASYYLHQPTKDQYFL